MAGGSAATHADAEERARRPELGARSAVVLALILLTAMILIARPSDEQDARVLAPSPPRGATGSPGYALAPATVTPSAGYPTLPTSTALATQPGGSASIAAGPGLVTTAVVRSWQSAGVTRAQVVAEVRNVSQGPIAFVPSGSRYRVLDRAGREVTHGVFTYAAPDRISPGAEAYLIDTVSTLFARPADIARVEVQPALTPAQTAATLLSIQDVTWRHATDGGLVATGNVTNDTDTEVASAFVCVVFVGRDGHPLGGVYDLTDVRELAPGSDKRFATGYPGTPPIAPQDVARVEAIALEMDVADE